MRTADGGNLPEQDEEKATGKTLLRRSIPLCSRVEAVEFGIVANEAEGLEVSPLFKALAGKYVRGEIGLREFHDRLDLHYYGRRGVSNGLSGCVY